MRFAIWFAVSLCFSAGLAQADLSFCNSAPLTIETAVGHLIGGQWFSEGWYQILPGDCRSILIGNLDSRYYYYYAQTSGGNHNWSGDTPFCTDSEPFKILDCTGEKQMFAKIDTADYKNFTQRFTCPECMDQNVVNAVRRQMPAIENLVNSQAPLSYRTEDWQDVGPVDIQYGINRGPFRISFSGNSIDVSTRLSYWVSVSANVPILGRRGLASCGIDEAEPVVDLALETIFGVTRDGHMYSKTRISNLSFLTSCNLTAADVDGRPYIENVVKPQLDRLTSMIDSQIRSIDISSWVNVDKLYGLR